MNSLRTTLTSQARNARLVLPLLTIGIASLTIADAQTAQTTTPPYAEFQNATITGFGNTINIGWLPIQLSNGLAFKNVSITFDVDSSGNLTIASGFPQVSAAPAIPVTEFVVGTYTANSIAGNAAIVVNGPGVTSAGAAAWSLSIAPSGNCNTYPASAQ